MAKLDFSWTYAAEESHPHVVFRLYENDIMVVDNIAAFNFSLLMDEHKPAKYAYFVTTVDTDTHLESAASETKDVDFFPPAAPTGFTASWTQ